LVDKRQRTIYQWGDYQVAESNNERRTEPIANEWLSYPLQGWRLEYYAPNNASGDTKLLIFIMAFLSLITLIGIGLRTVWRDYQRDLRNAEQRVSFVNQVSHELKTPLTNICIYADMLETEVTQAELPDRQRVKKFSNVVTSESQRLGRLINNVLNFSRAQQQKIMVHKSASVVDDIIMHTLGNYTPALQAKGITINTQLNAADAVMLDSELLEQVLNNLLSNVEKYAADGGLAEIHSEHHNEQTTILVCDAGQGIAIDLRDKIFEPFERGDNSLTEGASGTGIGLSIARDLCRLHGGDLQLIDKASGSNSTTKVLNGACFKATFHTEAAQ